MSKRVWKYTVSLTDVFELEMPTGAEPLTVQQQGADGMVCLWALVNPEATPTHYQFALVGTGHRIPEGIQRYVGTFQVEGGRLVFHLFLLH